LNEDDVGLAALDVFAGAGGFTLGMKSVGFQTKWFVEWVEDRRKTFAGHTPGAESIGEDVRKVDFRPLAGRVDVVYGGPPCQPFSSAGLRKGEADERNMVPEFVRCLEQVRPRAFVMENVAGLAVASRMTYLDGVLAHMRGLGYSVAWRTADAADYGVAQHRIRLFVVGMLGDEFRFPEATHGPSRQRPHVAVQDVLDVKHPLGDPPNCKVTYAKNPVLRQSPYAGMIFNGQGRPIDVTRPAPTITASAGGNKTHFFDTEQVVPAYHAHLRAEGLPRCGEVPGCRRLSVMESATLQGFPAETRFCGSRSSQYSQIGDAVPPPLAAALGRGVAAALGLRE